MGLGCKATFASYMMVFYGDAALTPKVGARVVHLIRLKMKTNFSLLFYLKKRNKYEGGALPIYLRITANGKRVEITTNRTCEPSRWNSKAGRMSGTKEDARDLNAYLDRLQANVYNAHQWIIERQFDVTAERLRDRFLGRKEKTHTLIEAIQQHNAEMEALVGKQYAKGTLSRFRVLERHVSAFMMVKYHVADKDIIQIDQAFIRDFDVYLRTEKACANNAAVKHIKNLGKILRICIANGWIERDPLLGYKLKTTPVDRVILNEDEMKRLAAKHFLTERLTHVRDVFLFCCFTGFSYSDVQSLRTIDVVKGVDGRQWITINRTKTNVRSSVPLLPTALEILERYAHHPFCVYHNKALPIISNQKMNEYLKEIATLCGIDKPLSSHIARHTFATTVTLLNGVPIESVSKMMGHTNIRTTQQYAKVLDIKISKDMEVLHQKYANGL